jgi:diguanylate cyclase (GGDEF)-like protein
MLLVSVPLAGGIASSVAAGLEARDREDHADATFDAARRASTATELRIALYDEWSTVRTGILMRGFGIDASAFESLTGLGLMAGSSVDANATRIETLAAEVDSSMLTAAIANARATAADHDAPRLEVGRAYTDTFDLAQAIADRSLDAMFDAAPAIDHNGEVQSAALLLLAASSARQHLELQEVEYWELHFPFFGDSDTALVNLISARASYGVLIESVEEQLTHGTAATTFDAVRSSPEMAQFQATIDETIGEGLEFGAPVVEVTGASGLLAIAPDLISMAHASVAVSDGHFEIVQAAVADLQAHTSAVRSRSADDARAAVFYALAAIVISMGLLLVIRWLIVRPLSAMGRVAAELRNGRLDVDVDEKGPREVRLAAQAMNEAIGHLRLAERQAEALAKVRLDDPYLTQSSPGLIGARLQEAVERLATTIAEGEELRAQLGHDAHHDSLTGLPNRAAAMELLERIALEMSDGDTDSPTAVLFVDLDGFKAVNDAHGHLFGDDVLCLVAARLRAAAEPDDFVARLGGDEFLIVTSMTSIEVAEELGETLIRELARPMAIGPLSVTLGASVGLVIASARGSQRSAEDLLHDVDLAVYRAKADGRGRVTMVDDELRAAAAHRVIVSRDLERALQTDELELFFQPVVSALDGELESFEALVRWRRPDGELLFPDSFVPVAEQSDLIVALDTRVLNLAARQLAEWTNHPVFGGVVVAVNLSGRHLDRLSVVRTVLGTLDAHGVDPHRLSIEVTETVLVSNPIVAARHLAELRAAGVCIAIDDFGTGYTSVAHLRSMPVDVLKIDRSFTAGLSKSGDQRLVKLMIDIGNHFDLRVIAEGVETAEQASVMRTLGIAALQGYFFARPVPLADLEAAVAGAQRVGRAAIADALVG